jgi:hypothetical protein
VVRSAAVVAFWLKSADTIPTEERDRVRDEFQYYTEQAMVFFQQQDLALVASSSDTLYVESSTGTRRAVMLAGLDYPYGYVLIDPGFPEQILTGVYTDEELIEVASDYFELEDDSVETRVAGACPPAGDLVRRGARQGAQAREARSRLGVSGEPVPARWAGVAGPILRRPGRLAWRWKTRWTSLTPDAASTGNRSARRSGSRRFR